MSRRLEVKIAQNSLRSVSLLAHHQGDQDLSLDRELATYVGRTVFLEWITTDDVTEAQRIRRVADFLMEAHDTVSLFERYGIRQDI